MDIKEPKKANTQKKPRKKTVSKIKAKKAEQDPSKSDKGDVKPEPRVPITPRQAFENFINYLFTENPVFRAEDAAIGLFSLAFYESMVFGNATRGALMVEFDREEADAPITIPTMITNKRLVWRSREEMLEIRRQNAANKDDPDMDTSLEAGLGVRGSEIINTYDIYSEYVVIVLWTYMDVVLQKTGTFNHVHKGKKQIRDDFDCVGYINRHFVSCACCYPINEDQSKFREFLAAPEVKRNEIIKRLSRCTRCGAEFFCVGVDGNDDKHESAKQFHDRECLAAYNRLVELEPLTSPLDSRKKIHEQVILTTLREIHTQTQIARFGLFPFDDKDLLTHDQRLFARGIRKQTGEINVSRRMKEEFLIMHPSEQERLVAWAALAERGVDLAKMILGHDENKTNENSEPKNDKPAKGKQKPRKKTVKKHQKSKPTSDNEDMDSSKD